MNIFSCDNNSKKCAKKYYSFLYVLFIYLFLTKPPPRSELCYCVVWKSDSKRKQSPKQDGRLCWGTVGCELLVLEDFNEHRLRSGALCFINAPPILHPDRTMSETLRLCSLFNFSPHQQLFPQALSTLNNALQFISFYCIFIYLLFYSAFMGTVFVLRVF